MNQDDESLDVLILPVLRGARKLIDAPEKWTQHAFARTAAGNSTVYYTEDAACFCWEGAVCRALLRFPLLTAEDRRELRAAIWTILCEAAEQAGLKHRNPDGSFGVPGLPNLYNDHHDTTHGDIMRAHDQAISNVEAA